MVDESWYLDTTQRDSLGAFLDTADGVKQQIWLLGRDMSYGSSARPWMEQYTGSAYVKDDPSWRQLTSTPSDPIGNDETFTISGSYPDELQLSTTYPGGQVVYRYSALSNSKEIYETETELRQFYQKEGKYYDPRLWPMAPSGPDSAAAVRYVGTNHVSVYFSFNFNYIQEDTRRAAILGRVFDWMAASADGGLDRDVALQNATPDIPDKLTLDQNYPNPFNPVTRIRIGVPKDVKGKVSLKVFNARGQLVKTIFEGTKTPGFHAFEWDATNNAGNSVSTGVYFARFTADRTKLVRKMVLLK
jgi:hypothetical protein